ncbi:MAG: WG repeat-containing protein [Clostridia bacterium]|nr:WG repeat-containing protein [Clostridia bacterium]
MGKKQTAQAAQTEKQGTKKSFWMGILVGFAVFTVAAGLAFSAYSIFSGSKGTVWEWARDVLGISEKDPAEETVQYCYINTDGEVVIGERWATVGDFNSGYAPVMNDQKLWGMIDVNGVLALEPQYPYISFFSEGLVAFAGQDEYFGYMNEDFEVVIEPSFYMASFFSEGVAAAFDSHTEKWGFIDSYGNWAIEPQWDDCFFFSDGICQVINYVDADTEDGSGYTTESFYINKKGETVFRTDRQTIGYFSEGLMAYLDANSQLKGFLNTQGKVALVAKWANCLNFSEGLAAVMNDKMMWGFINAKGEQVIDFLFTDCGSFTEGLAPVRDANGLWGYIDQNGSWVIAPQFEEAYNFSEGLGIVRRVQK